jgi:hypothetical protein
LANTIIKSMLLESRKGFQLLLLLFKLEDLLNTSVSVVNDLICVGLKLLFEISGYRVDLNLVL